MPIDSKTRTRIRSALRKISRWTEPIKNTRARARIKPGEYKCELCGDIVKKVDIDHFPKDVGPTPGSRNAPEGYTWDEFINNLFCDESNLRAICRPCHKDHTKSQRKGKKK